MYINSIIKLLKGKERKFGKHPRENRYNALKGATMVLKAEFSTEII